MISDMEEESLDRENLQRSEVLANKMGRLKNVRTTG